MGTDLAAPIRILLCDGHAVVRAGLRMLIESQLGYQVVAEAGDCAEATALAAAGRPDVVLMSLDRLEKATVVDVERFRASADGSRVLVLTGGGELDLLRGVIRRGARGVVFEKGPAEALLKAIRKVHDGELWLGRTIVAELVGDMEGSHDPEQARIKFLTSRELQIVRLVAVGLRNKEIARRLRITANTVRHHLTTVFEKLDVRDRVSLVIFAIRYHLASARQEK